MSDILQEIAAAIKRGDIIEIGSVDKYIGGGKYTVTLSGREKIATSAIDRPLQVGTQVVINSTDSGRFIIGTSRHLKTATIQEVTINA